MNISPSTTVADVHVEEATRVKLPLSCSFSSTYRSKNVSSYYLEIGLLCTAAIGVNYKDLAPSGNKSFPFINSKEFPHFHVRSTSSSLLPVGLMFLTDAVNRCAPYEQSAHHMMELFKFFLSPRADFSLSWFIYVLFFHTGTVFSCIYCIRTDFVLLSSKVFVVQLVDKTILFPVFVFWSKNTHTQQPAKDQQSVI